MQLVFYLGKKMQDLQYSCKKILDFTDVIYLQFLQMESSSTSS